MSWPFEPQFGDLLYWQGGTARITAIWLGWVPDKAYGLHMVIQSEGLTAKQWLPGGVHDFLPDYLEGSGWVWEPRET